MKKNDKEINKILAETILRHCEKDTQNGYECMFCGDIKTGGER